MKKASAFFIILFLPMYLLAQNQQLPQPTQTQMPQVPQYTQEPVSNMPSTANLKTQPTADTKIGERDPFAPPKYIRDLELIRPEDLVDNKMEAIRRWPLSDYKLQGIIWDVKNPKAIIVDKFKTLHLLKKNYRIGHREGIISEIHESEIIVLQKGLPIVIPIQQAAEKETLTEVTKGNLDLKNTSPEFMKRQQELATLKQNGQQNSQQSGGPAQQVSPQNSVPMPTGNK